MADPIDPRLYASSLPPRTQSYTSAPQHNTGQPYYLPSPTQHHAPQQLPPPAPLSHSLDPALEQTSPTGPAESHDEDDGDDDGDQDGYVKHSNEL
jgi:hypothetical protein